MSQCSWRLSGFLNLGLLLLVLVLTACSQPVQAQPGPRPSPTWGTFFPTVVPFPSPTVMEKGKGTTFWRGRDDPQRMDMVGGEKRPDARPMLWLMGGLRAMVTPAADARTAMLTPSHVAFPSCAGTGCNNQDAYTTGCAGDSASYWVVDSVPVTWQGVKYGWAQLWYSATCGTNWARYACTSLCRTVALTLMVCEANGSQDAVQGPLTLAATGRTTQQYLPTTRAATNVLFPVVGREYSGAATGCY